MTTRQRAWLAAVLLLAALVGLGGLVVVGEDALFGLALSEKAFAELIRSWGAWGIAGSVGLMVVHSFVPFPAEFLALANGMVYGAFWGSVVTWIGAMLGAFLAFGLARWLGRPFVERMVRERHRRVIDAWSRREGGLVLLLSRLIPVIAFNLINYAAGLTAIGWWTFAWATGIGILPVTVLMAFMGANMTAIPWWLWLLLTAVAVAAGLALRRLHRHAERRNYRDSSDVPG